MRNHGVKRIATLGLACATLAGCSREFHRRDADNEVYRIEQAKRQGVPELTANLELTPPPEDPLSGLPRVAASRPAEAEAERPASATTQPSQAVLITLSSALELAAANNRDYQSQKEAVYLTALDLTLERHRFDVIFAGSISGAYHSEPVARVKQPDLPEKAARQLARDLFVQAMTPVLGANAAQSIGQPDAARTVIEHDERLSADGDLNARKLMGNGGTILADVASQLLRHLTGDPRRLAASVLTLNYVQPLLRGADAKVVRENLVQAERNTLYQLRAFARYRQVFSADVASDYYRLLQLRDRVENAWQNYQRLIATRKRIASFAEEARLTQLEVDQARQDELEARDGWIITIQQLEQAVDQFKISLGIPADVEITIDESELDRLRAEELRNPSITLSDAVAVSQEARLDLANQKDQFDDAVRKVEVAADALKSELTLTGNVTFPTDQATHLTKFRLDRGTWDLGLEFDPPLERKAERNAYRRALIAVEQSRRDYTLLRDTTVLAVRAAYRNLEQARESLTIQRRALSLAEQRVASTNLLIELARATTRDLLEAQRALLAAQNAVTRGIIDHTVARLNFYRDVGILAVGPTGLYKEPNHQPANAS